MANLHLVVNEEIKQKAKVIAKQQGENLSTLVETYLFNLVRQRDSSTARLSKDDSIVDSNVVYDYSGKRHPHYEYAVTLLSLGLQGKVTISL